MLHPNYQYTPNLLVAMSSLIAVGQDDDQTFARNHKSRGLEATNFGDGALD
jgi:hypothetical protein